MQERKSSRRSRTGRIAAIGELECSAGIRAFAGAGDAIDDRENRACEIVGGCRRAVLVGHDLGAGANTQRLFRQ
jgi:hypothetical protein